MGYGIDLYRILGGIENGRGDLGNTGVDGRIISVRIFRK
jgi:hypothetical protein